VLRRPRTTSRVALDELLRERAEALVFLRHYLCVQCRVGSMNSSATAICTAPTRICSWSEWARLSRPALTRQTGVTFRVLLSPDTTAYEAMDLPRGSLRQVFGIAAQRAARRRARGIGRESAAAAGTGRSDAVPSAPGAAGVRVWEVMSRGRGPRVG